MMKKKEEKINRGIAIPFHLILFHLLLSSLDQTRQMSLLQAIPHGTKTDKSIPLREEENQFCREKESLFPFCISVQAQVSLFCQVHISNSFLFFSSPLSVLFGLSAPIRSNNRQEQAETSYLFCNKRTEYRQARQDQIKRQMTPMNANKQACPFFQSQTRPF